jgi:hypothetical protein
MPTIQGEKIGRLISQFKNRGVKFYHACQYKDFKTYLEIGGVPSRNLMERSGQPYTVFDTDNIDRENEVWNKVFGNLQDLGKGFAQGQRNENTAPTPNPYGPILLIFKPEVFTEALDVAISLRSAGGRDFNRENEALASAEIVNLIFLYEDITQAPNEYSKAHLKYSRALIETFGDQNAGSPEVSCVVPNEKFSFKRLIIICVDPYIINGQNLKEEVRSLKVQHRLGCVVWERRYREGRREMIQELANLLHDGFVSIPELIRSQNISDSLRDYAVRIQRGKMEFFYNRFASYLRTGTILELNAEEG